MSKIFCFRQDDPYAVEYVEESIIDEMVASGVLQPEELENGSLKFDWVEWEILNRGILARQKMDFLTAEIERRKKELIDQAVDTNDSNTIWSVRADIQDADIILKEGLEELRKTLLYKVAEYPARLNLESALYQQAVDMLGDTAIRCNLIIYWDGLE